MNGSKYKFPGQPFYPPGSADLQSQKWLRKIMQATASIPLIYLIEAVACVALRCHFRLHHSLKLDGRITDYHTNA